MALSLRQGPLLAAIGLLASMATPLLIETETPSLLMLVVYLVLIGGAALVLSRRTGWGWLASGTVFGWLGWSLMTYEAATNGQLSLWSAFLALGFIVTVWFAEKEETKKQSADLNSLNLQPGLAVFWGGLAAILVTVVGGVSGDFLAGAERPEFSLGLASVAVVERRIHREDLAFRKGWSVFAVILGLTSVIALSVEITQSVGTTDRVFAALALGYGALFAAASVWFRRQGREWLTLVIPVLGAGLAWLLASVLAFEDLAFSLFMSLGGALAALTIWRVKMPGARLVLLGLIGFVFAHALLIQFPEIDVISTRPVFNALWAYL